MPNSNINSIGLKELEISFDGRGEVKGYKFEQIMKSDKAYIYKKNLEDITTYEVFKRMENVQFGCVSYPGSKSFGLWAWEYYHYDLALLCFKKLSE